MGAVVVHTVDHFGVLGLELRTQELHRVPLVVASPVLPVLHHAIDGYT